MNMGKRLKKELDDRGMAPVQLCALVPDLDIGTLSAIYTRDSRGSKYAPDIASALGLDLRWLITGEGEKKASRPNASPLKDPADLPHTGSDEALILAAFPLLVEEMRESWIESAKKAIARNGPDQQRANGTKRRDLRLIVNPAPPGTTDREAGIEGAWRGSSGQQGETGLAPPPPTQSENMS